MDRTIRLVAGLLVSIVALAGLARAGDDNVYQGAEKCKNCHAVAGHGDQYGKWTASKHHKAFETLATDEAKKIAKAKGIDDPQKSDQCLKCHETAFGVPAAQKNKKFDPTQGVQCESCHGPAGNHVKARLASEEESGEKRLTIGKDEINPMPKADTCKKCHNADSPNFKGFNYKKMAKEIAHLDPRVPRPADYFDKLPDDGPAEKK